MKTKFGKDGSYTLHDEPIKFGPRRDKDAEIAALKAENDRLQILAEHLLGEMRMHLPILQALEAKPSAWEWYTHSTGIATLNGYRNAIGKARQALRGDSQGESSDE